MRTHELKAFLAKTRLQPIEDKIADNMIAIVDADPRSYIENIDFESIFEKCFDRVFGNLPDPEYSKKYAQIETSQEVKSAYEVMKDIVDEARIDAEYALDIQSNPVKYYGSVHDYD